MDLKEAEKRIADLERELEVQQLIADSAFEAIGVFDENLLCVAVNNQIVNMFGYLKEEILGKPPTYLLSEDSMEVVARNVRNRVSEPYFVTGRRSDGSLFPAEVRGRTVTLHGKDHRVTAIRDITFLRSTEADLRSALHELELIFSSSKVGLMFLQGGRVLKRANQALADILGYDTPEEMEGLSMRKLHLSEKAFTEYGERYFKTLAEGAQLNIEYQLRRKDGSAVWCSLSGQAVYREHPIDLSKGVLWAVDDIAVRKTEEERLMRLATTDDLTGALNRKEFFRQVSFAMAMDKRCPAGPSMLMIDLDYFKEVNDQYGHEAGDAVLRFFAQTCRGLLREGDLFARMGGEEFAIFLPEADLGGAIGAAERIRKRFGSRDISTTVGNVHCTMSIGVAGPTSHELTVHEMLQRADKALYEAKKDGRDKVAFWD